MYLMPSLTDYGRPMKPFFSSKSQSFGLGQTICADNVWDIWGILGQFIAPILVMSPLYMFSINQPLLLLKTKPLNLNSKLFISDWDLNLGLKESVI